RRADRGGVDDRNLDVAPEQRVRGAEAGDASADHDCAAGLRAHPGRVDSPPPRMFRVGGTRDFRSEGGSFLFAPAVDLAAPQADGRVEWEYLARAEPVLGAALVEGFDALLLLGPKVTTETLAGNDRLLLVARSGVGLDAVDLDACTAAGVAVTITPDAVA